MNNKAQTPVGFIFSVIALIFVWFIFLGEWFTIVGNNALMTGITGVEAFFYANLNLWFWLAMVLWIVGYGYFSQR
jgi:hypothetical protein